MTEARSGEQIVSSPQGEFDTLRYVSAEVPCPYLPALQSRHEAFYVASIEAGPYERLLTKGFRRSGRILYRPRCRTCGECRSIRIPAGSLTLTRSQRRVLRRNLDVHVEVGEPSPTTEKFELFCRYLDAQHDETMTRAYESFCDFLYDSPIETCEFCYYLGQRLIGVGLADRWDGGLSSVYMYFDPEFSGRSLGTFSVLWEVDYCRREGHQYYYLGYYVAGSPKMAYKCRFRPNEVLVGEDRWVKLS